MTTPSILRHSKTHRTIQAKRRAEREANQWYVWTLRPRLEWTRSGEDFSKIMQRWTQQLPPGCSWATCAPSLDDPLGQNIVVRAPGRVTLPAWLEVVRSTPVPVPKHGTWR